MRDETREELDFLWERRRDGPRFQVLDDDIKSVQVADRNRTPRAAARVSPAVGSPVRDAARIRTWDRRGIPTLSPKSGLPVCVVNTGIPRRLAVGNNEIGYRARRCISRTRYANSLGEQERTIRNSSSIPSLFSFPSLILPSHRRSDSSDAQTNFDRWTWRRILLGILRRDPLLTRAH